MDLYIYPPTPVSVSVPPIQYEDEFGTITTVTPTDRLPVQDEPTTFLQGPTGNLARQIVQKDTLDANNTAGLPVQIVGADGTEISITAGDINVQTSHSGVNPDSMQIGDGTETLDINTDNEALVHDQDVQDKLDTLSAQVPTTLGQKPMADSLAVTISSDQSAIDVNDIGGSISLPTGAATEAKQDDGITELQAIKGLDFATEASLSSVDTKTPDLGQALAAGSVPVIFTSAQETVLTETKDAVESLATKVGTTGIDVDFQDIGDVATETTLKSISDDQLPATLGAKTAADSLAVTLPTDQGALRIVEQHVRAFNRVDFSVTNVTDASYVAFNTDTGSIAFTKVRIFYAGGEPLYLAIGAAASEIDTVMIPPGADFEIGTLINPNSRLSLKAVNASTTINSGQIIFNWMA